MNTIKIEFDIPESLATYVDITNPQYQTNLRQLMIYQLINEGKISFGKAAEILETDSISLITGLGKMGIAFFDYDLKEVLEDADNFKNIAGGKM